jgi:hypothetical protein
VFVASFVPIMVSSSLDDDGEYENPPLLAHLPLDESIEREPTLVPPLPKWVCLAREAIGDLVIYPLDQHRTRSQFQQDSCLLSQVSETCDLETFAKA